MASLSTPDPSLYKERSHNNYTLHHYVSMMVSHNTTLVPSLGLRIGPACEAGLSIGMQRERVPPPKDKDKDKDIRTRDIDS